MKLTKLVIEGFGSIIDKTTYRLDRVGLNLILGKNGSGKTSILNSLSYVLYKKLLKKKSDFRPWPHIIDSGFQGTKVSLFFQDEFHKFKVIRCDDYTGKIEGKKGGDSLFIYEDEKLVFTERNKNDANAWIVKKIGYSFDLFRSTILFAQELTKLMDEDGPQKKRIFDEAFESMFISRALDLAKKELEKYQDIQEDNLNAVKIEKEKLKAQRNEKETILLIKRTWQERQNTNCNTLLTEIQAQEGELEKLISEKGKVKVKDIKLTGKRQLLKDLKLKQDFKVSNQEFKISLEINNKQAELEKVIDKITQSAFELLNVPKNCKTCGQALTREKIKLYQKAIHDSRVELKGQKKELEEKILDLQQKHKELKEAVDFQQQLVRDIHSVESVVSLLEQKHSQRAIIYEKINSKRDRIKNLNDQIATIKREKAPIQNLAKIKASIAETKGTIAGSMDYVRRCSKQIKIHEWLIKDPLSNSGLKTFIFDSMLGRVNNHLKWYTKHIHFEVKVYIDMATANKDMCVSIFKADNEVPYEDLSGGQKQLVRLVLGFSLYDTVTAIKPLNCLFADELFESLDDENVEIIGNIIREKSINKSIHLITHQSKFSPTNSRITYVELNDQGKSIVSSS